MAGYFSWRILVSIPTLIGISLVCFALVQLTPGGPVEMTLAEWSHSSVGSEGAGNRVSQITEEQRQNLIEYYGFDKPLWKRYLIWMNKVGHLDFGDSYYYNEPVLAVIKRCLPVSLTFGLVSFILTYMVCIPLGVAKATREGSHFDIFSSGLVFFLYSIPSFAFGIVLIVLFGGGSFWRVFPIEGMVSDNFSDLSFVQKIWDFCYHMFLPLTCYVVGGFASLTMIMKDSLIEQLKMDYVTTARMKGLAEKKVIMKHAFRNALLPIANGLGHWVSLFFAGSLLIETIFSLQGIGRLSYDSIVHRDYPIVLANIMIVSALDIVGTLISDFLYTVIDPRIDFT